MKSNVIRLNQTTTQKSNAASALTPEVQTFNVFMACLYDVMATIQPDYRLVFKSELVKSLAECDDSTLSSLTIRHIINKGQDFKVLSVTAMELLFDQCYVVLCDVFGPVDADSIMSRGINMTEAHEVSLAFSIKNLL